MLREVRAPLRKAFASPLTDPHLNGLCIGHHWDSTECINSLAADDLISRLGAWHIDELKSNRLLGVRQLKGKCQLILAGFQVHVDWASNGNRLGAKP